MYSESTNIHVCLKHGPYSFIYSCLKRRDFLKSTWGQKKTALSVQKKILDFTCASVKVILIYEAQKLISCN